MASGGFPSGAEVTLHNLTQSPENCISQAGAVKHPSDWPHCGYNEIQSPKRKNLLINYERLRDLLGFDSYEKLQAAHEKWVSSCLENGDNHRDDKWTVSLSVGSRAFVENVHSLMGLSAIGRQVRDAGESYQLREAQAPYGDHFGDKKGDIGLDNGFLWS